MKTPAPATKRRLAQAARRLQKGLQMARVAAIDIASAALECSDREVVKHVTTQAHAFSALMDGAMTVSRVLQAEVCDVTKEPL